MIINRQNSHCADLDIIGIKAARPLRVDLQPNLFDELRAQQQPQFVDALETDNSQLTDDSLQAVSLFAPGCVLSAASAPLVGAVYDWLLEHEAVDGLTVCCCGNILKSVALPSEREAYLVELRASLLKRNVCKIVTACPNCFKAYKLLALDGVEIVPLSEAIATRNPQFTICNFEESGVGEATTYCVHDSCPDRVSGRFASSVRALFADVELREMEHSRSRSLCCGLGKMRAMTQPQKSTKIHARRTEEFGDTGAQILLTYCATCTQAFQSQAAARPNRRYAYHYLELLFGIKIDWDWFFVAYQDAFNSLQELADEPSN